MKVAELARALGAVCVGDASVDVNGVQHDSRRVLPGELFAAIRGGTSDGRTFLPAVEGAGAGAVLADAPVTSKLPVLTVADTRRALGAASHLVYGNPSASLDCVGITGTNGKTTTTWLIEGALVALGKAPALLGTVVSRIGDAVEPSMHTTPEADDLARFLVRAVTAGATHVAMEVSSHGLAQHRVDGTRFKVAGFTNLTRDHLDFHGTEDAYRIAKERLFFDLAPDNAVINVDDIAGRNLASRVPGPVLRCSVRGDAQADLRTRSWTMDRDGIRAQLDSPDGPVEIASPLVGAHNLENLLVAMGSLIALGFRAHAAAEALRTQRGAPGRLERVPHPGDVAVLVDYAHTPDALANVLRAVRPFTEGRVIAVFGCGGDRDRTKRPLMASAVAAAADLAVLTSDNPRTEDPNVIMEDARTGFGDFPSIDGSALRDASRGYVAVVDRRDAIRVALRAAKPGDTVLIAGKGHEDYQIIGTEKRPFDDRREAAAAAEEAN